MFLSLNISPVKHFNLLGLSGHIRGQHILALMSTIVFTAELVVLWTRMGVLTLPPGGVRSL